MHSSPDGALTQTRLYGDFGPKVSETACTLLLMGFFFTGNLLLSNPTLQRVLYRVGVAWPGRTPIIEPFAHGFLARPDVPLVGYHLKEQAYGPHLGGSKWLILPAQEARSSHAATYTWRRAMISAMASSAASGRGGTWWSERIMRANPRARVAMFWLPRFTQRS